LAGGFQENSSITNGRKTRSASNLNCTANAIISTAHHIYTYTSPSDPVNYKLFIFYLRYLSSVHV